MTASEGRGSSLVIARCNLSKIRWPDDEPIRELRKYRVRGVCRAFDSVPLNQLHHPCLSQRLVRVSGCRARRIPVILAVKSVPVPVESQPRTDPLRQLDERRDGSAEPRVGVWQCIIATNDRFTPSPILPCQVSVCSAVATGGFEVAPADCA